MRYERPVVSHGGIVLATRDGGRTWEKQLDGAQAASLILRQAAKAADAVNASKLAQQLVDDDPDKPFLNLYFTDRLHGYVIGGYRKTMCRRYADGLQPRFGKIWVIGRGEIGHNGWQRQTKMVDTWVDGRLQFFYTD
ncbi:hypothetical protein SAMN04515618_101160 [Collimonas sp. OK307]|uniref:hypothetical protein n=1 Tax=Collimonas sp. OK307 TaxID=1801620 RepID=UPI0008EC1E21|nr:hypothetical protein [Collimonas sp. OK307]SFH62050.1 hypothetical protein SAMN04515618_101160 [Collimonas sp. OK307]